MNQSKINKQELFNIIKQYGEIPQIKLRELTGLNPSTLSGRLKSLKTQGKITTRKIRQGRSYINIVYLKSEHADYKISNQIEIQSPLSRIYNEVKIRISIENTELFCESKIEVRTLEGVNTGYQEQFKMFFLIIMRMICITTRRFQELHPKMSNKDVVELTRILMKSGFRRGIQKLASKNIIVSDGELGSNITGFQEQLEQYTYIFTELVRSITHRLQVLNPNIQNKRIFDLTLNFIEIAVYHGIAILIPKGVLQHRCSGCFYPFVEPPMDMQSCSLPSQQTQCHTIKSIDQIDNPYQKSEKFNKSQLPNINYPLSDQILQFIGNYEKGVTIDVIQTYFQQFGYTKEIIRNELNKLVSEEGEIYLPEAGKYKIL
ncbi:MAG: helix-turn-helix transcriptional regulator [Promethearchaeota archaeon]